MSGCSGILGKRFEIGHISKQWNGHTVAATQSLRRREIREEIVKIIPDFQPPTVTVDSQVIAEGLFTGETVERTLGDLLWSAWRESETVVTALDKIFRTNLAATDLPIRGMNGLGEIFNPFSIDWKSSTARFDYTGNDYQPFLMLDTAGTRTILEAGGLTRCEIADGLENRQMSASYTVKDGMIVTDWRNSIRIKQLLMWATGLPLSFLPHYRAASYIDSNPTAFPQMDAIIDACSLKQRPVSFFWLGISGFQYAESPRVIVLDPAAKGRSGRVSDSETQDLAAVFLTLAKEKIEK